MSPTLRQFAARRGEYYGRSALHRVSACFLREGVRPPVRQQGARSNDREAVLPARCLRAAVLPRSRAIEAGTSTTGTTKTTT